MVDRDKFDFGAKTIRRSSVRTRMRYLRNKP